MRYFLSYTPGIKHKSNDKCASIADLDIVTWSFPELWGHTHTHTRHGIGIVKSAETIFVTFCCVKSHVNTIMLFLLANTCLWFCVW